MISLSEYQILFSIQIAILSYTTSVLLTEPNMILFWYYRLLERLKMRFSWGSYIAYPLGYCEKCFAGQLAFWIYLLEYRIDSAQTVANWLLFTGVTIFFTYIISQIITRYVE